MPMALKMHTSRKISSQRSHDGSRCEPQRTAMAERPITLSAMGSSTAPMCVNCLSMRAAMPSSQSVIMAKMKTARAAPMRPERNSQRKTGTATSRRPVRELGRSGSLRRGVALLVPERERVVLVHVGREGLGVTGGAIRPDHDLHLAAHQLLPLLARHFLRTLDFVPLPTGGGSGRALSHRHRPVVHAHQHALVRVGVDPEDGAAHPGHRILRLDLEALLALDDGRHPGPELSEEQLCRQPALRRAAVEVSFGELESRLRAEAEHRSVAEADLQASAGLGLDGVALPQGGADAQRKRRGAGARLLRPALQRGDLRGLRRRQRRRRQHRTGAQQPHCRSSRSTVLAVTPMTLTENLPSFFPSTSVANCSVDPSSITSSSCVPAAKLRCETPFTPRTCWVSALRKSLAVLKLGTLRTVTCPSFPAETSCDQRAPIFLIMSCAKAREAFLMASLPQESSSICAAACVASEVVRMSPLSVLTARPLMLAAHDFQPGPSSAISPRLVAMTWPTRITSAPVSDLSLRACAAVISVVRLPTCAVFSVATSGSMSWRNPPILSWSSTVFSAMRRSAATSAFWPPRIQAAAGAAIPMFCSAISTMVRGMPLRAINRPIASRSLSSSALPM